MPRRWLVLILIVAACGGTPAPRPRSPTYLAEIRIEGNGAIPDDELVPGLQLDRTRQGRRAVDPYQLTLDTDRIRNAYLQQGYFRVAVDVRIDGPPGGAAGAQTVVFTVTEGPRARARIEIAGLPPEVSLAEGRARVPLDDGAPFDYVAYDLGKQALLDLVEDAGYAHVDIDAEVVEVDGAARVRYQLIAGPRCRFGSIVIRGVDGPLRRAIIGRLAIASGQPYSLSKVKASQAQIYQLGRFSSVRVVPERDAGSVVIPVSILVTRTDSGEVKAGVGGQYNRISPDVHGQGGVSYVPDAMPLWTLGLDARLALVFRQREGEARTLDPQARVLASAQRLELLRPRVIGDVGVGYDFVTFEAYTARGPFAQLGVTSPLFARWLTLRVGWSLTKWTFSGISEALDATARQTYGLDGASRIGTYQQMLTVEKRDHPTSPRSGVYFTLRAVEGTRFAGGAYEYLQLSPDLRGYVPLGPVVLGLRGRLGVFFGEAPVTERFFGGGAQSQRGFGLRELAPTVVRDVDGELRAAPIGGTALVETSAELRMRLFTLGEWIFIGNVFLDGADVVETRDELFARMLHLAAGFGFGVDFSGIKVHLDLGFRLNRTGPDEVDYQSGTRWPAFHLVVGDAF